MNGKKHVVLTVPPTFYNHLIYNDKQLGQSQEELLTLPVHKTNENDPFYLPIALTSTAFPKYLGFPKHFPKVTVHER